MLRRISMVGAHVVAHVMLLIMSCEGKALETLGCSATFDDASSCACIDWPTIQCHYTSGSGQTTSTTIQINPENNALALIFYLKACNASIEFGFLSSTSQTPYVSSLLTTTQPSSVSDKQTSLTTKQLSTSPSDKSTTDRGTSNSFPSTTGKVIKDSSTGASFGSTSSYSVPKAQTSTFPTESASTSQTYFETTADAANIDKDTCHVTCGSCPEIVKLIFGAAAISTGTQLTVVIVALCCLVRRKRKSRHDKISPKDTEELKQDRQPPKQNEEPSLRPCGCLRRQRKQEATEV